MPWAQLPAINLYFEIRGSGPRVFFLGGTGGDLRKPDTPFDRLLDKHFEVLRFDPRGMGQSDKPPGPYSMQGYADDAAALLKHFGWGRVAVLGYSFGGMVAQELALRHPATVARLALVSTTAGGAGGSSYPLHELSDLGVEARAQRMLTLSDTRRDAAWAAAHPAMYQAMYDHVLAGLKFAADEPGHQAGAQAQLAARRLHDTWFRLPSLRLPVAVFGGEHDGVAPPAAVIALANRIPGASLQLFEGGHLAHVQNAAAAVAIVDWLADQSD